MKDRFEEVLATYFDKVDSGEEVDPNNFIASHPDLSQKLEQFFNNLGVLNSLIDQAHTPAAGGRTPQPIPEKIDRYQVQTVLGEGGFGRVFLAFDEQLQRHVAIKVPHSDSQIRIDQRERFIGEGRNLARLRHPGLLAVFDAGVDPDGQCYTVMEYVEGESLAEKLAQTKFSSTEVIALGIQIADGLQAAHEAGIVHRDLKPSNVLVDEDSRVYIADFGLAICHERQWELDGELAGTRPYMSPEQLRGETHRLDGRTDIWAVGVLLYELLARRRPFRSYGVRQLLKEIESETPRPLRQVDASIPMELARICEKCLQERMGDRYASAAELSKDLKRLQNSDQRTHIITATVFDEVAHQLTPPGVRSFESTDAEPYTLLLPGLRDGAGCPETLRFWICKLDSRNGAETFPIGLVYGPSGSGKSSFMKAGVRPRLKRCKTVMFDATKSETENRLRESLQRALPSALSPSDWDRIPLAGLLSHLRRWCQDRGEKLVIVIDQLEQWLSAWNGEPSAGFIAALRQCDGASLQAVLVVRDDFWLAVSRLMQALEQQIVDGKNSQLIDLFEPEHALNVLRGLGRAYRVLPAYPDPLTGSQQEFLERAIHELSRNRRIAPVQLSLLAEMVKGETWEPRALDLLGGVKGIGVRFLEQTFCATSAPATHRCHSAAVQSVLRLLLPLGGPEQSTTIKGQSRSIQEIREASGYAKGSDEFADLLRLLEQKTRLLTPVDSIRHHRESSTDEQRHYHLAHDYLVPSLQEWLARSEALTWRGRVRQMLQRLHGMWSTYEDTRHLPRLTEWLQIRALIPDSELTHSQARMMWEAQGRFFRSGAILACLAGILGFFAWESHGRMRSIHLTDALIHSPAEDVPSLIGKLDNYRYWANPRMKEVLAQARRDENPKIERRAQLALVLTDRKQLPLLLMHLRVAPLDELSSLIEVLDAVPYAHCDPTQLWCDLQAGDQPAATRIRIAAFLAHRDSHHANWNRVADELASLLSGQLPTEHKQWAKLLQPIAGHLLPPLARKTMESPNGNELRLAAGLYHEIAQVANERSEPLRDLLDTCLNADSPLAIDDARQAAAAAVAFATIGQWDEVDRLFRRSVDPTIRSYLIQYLTDGKLGVEVLVGRLRSANDPGTRTGLILAIGSAGKTQSMRSRREVVPTLLKICADSEAAGVWHAMSWTLREWGIPQKFVEQHRSVLTQKPCFRDWRALGNQDWMNDYPIRTVGSSRPLEASMVCYYPATLRNVTEEKPLSQAFAFGTTEVTVEEFLRFRPEHESSQRKSPEADCPVNEVTWYDAAAYCNWLSEQCGIPQDQWAYVPNEQGLYEEGMKAVDDVLTCQGFRLPTEAEWNFACRGTAATSWSFGNDRMVAGEYAWYQANSGNRSHRVGLLKPNESGLFDMHGNVWEWSHDQTLSGKQQKRFRLCGGTHIDSSLELRVETQNWNPPYKHTDADGFRVCRTLPIKTTALKEVKATDEPTQSSDP